VKYEPNVHNSIALHYRRIFNVHIADVVLMLSIKDTSKRSNINRFSSSHLQYLVMC
jgi:hypothetical protein